MKGREILLASFVGALLLPTTLFAGGDFISAQRRASLIAQGAQRQASLIAQRGQRNATHEALQVQHQANLGYHYQPVHDNYRGGHHRVVKKVVIVPQHNSYGYGGGGYCCGDKPWLGPAIRGGANVVSGLFNAFAVSGAVDAAERVELERIRARVVTGTMGQEGAVLYDSPNGPTSLRASYDPSFLGRTVVARRPPTPSYTEPSASAPLPLPSVNLRALRKVRDFMDAAGADDAEFAALEDAILEIGDTKHRAVETDRLRRDVRILRYLLRKLERTGAPQAQITALEDAIEYIHRGIG